MPQLESPGNPVIFPKQAYKRDKRRQKVTIFRCPCIGFEKPVSRVRFSTTLLPAYRARGMFW